MNGKRRVVLVLLCCAVLPALVVALAPREREPEYQDRKLSEWLMRASADSVFRYSPVTAELEAQTAVRAIGANGIPWMLKWLSYEPWPWQEKLRGRCQMLPGPLRTAAQALGAEPKIPWGYQHRSALEGLEILGPQAVPAIPKLQELAKSSSWVTRGYAAMALDIIDRAEQKAVKVLIPN